jgi:outer membrane protein assembly factor BamB
VLENKLLVSYPGRLIAFEAGSGKELWSCSGLGKLVYTSPLAREGIAVSMSGFMGPPLAVRLGGKGEVTESRRLWRQERAQQRIGSGVIHEGHIYILNDPGVLECIRLKTGESVWKNRLAGKSWSSVVLSGDRLYTADDGGSCFVVKASPSFKILARNELGERIRASISISNGRLFIRSYKHLWCISKP